MQFTYCPQCGSLELMHSPNGMQCRKCRYLGPMSEGPMDKINEVRKRGARIAPSNASKPDSDQTKQAMNELAERLKSLKGKSTSDAEFL